MAIREQDDIPYRSLVQPDGPPPQASSVNEENYNTLKIVQGILHEATEALYKNFNAFDVLKDKDVDDATENLLRQIEAKQGAYDILIPVVEAVDSAILAVDQKYKQ